MEVNHRELKSSGRLDNLERSPVCQLDRGTQDLVPPQDLIEAPLQRGDIEASSEAPSTAQVVNRAARFQLLHEPKPLLRE